jgi:hypothetical protein
MPAITLVVTNAGRAALVDAVNAGTFAVRIAAAGLSATAFTPLATAVALPGEFARINGVSGAAVDPATISLVIRDDSNAAYTLRALGLFLNDGTLFAIHSQPGAILEKSADSVALIVVDVRFADIDATMLTFGDANFLNPPATTSVQGVVELATDIETIAGDDAIRAATPAGIKAALDSRFGVGAASTFVRTLLTAASATAFRITLGLKSAALKDEGSGNGLDADTLDGHQLRIGANAVTWPGVPFVQPDGVMEVGQRLDFHAINNDPADATAFLGLSGSNFARNGNRLWDAGNDGAGSGLDADLLDGQDGSFYSNIPARLGYTPLNRGGDTLAGRLASSGNFGGSGMSTGIGGLGEIEVRNNGTGAAMMSFHRQGQFAAYLGIDTDNQLKVGGWSIGSFAYVLWHAGNDGAGSGLDADLLDGQDGSFYTNIAARLGYTPYNASNPAGYINGINGGMVTGALGYTPWHAGNDGAGSGLDADLLDGRDAGSFANASHSHGAPDLAPAFGNASLGASGYQAFPGGLLIQWGQYRSFFAGEGSAYVAFPAGFSEAPFSITTTAVNPGSSNQRDTTIQIINRDSVGFNVYFQNNGGSAGNVDGFDWIAIGRYF